MEERYLEEIGVNNKKMKTEMDGTNKEETPPIPLIKGFENSKFRKFRVPKIQKFQYFGNMGNGGKILGRN